MFTGLIEAIGTVVQSEGDAPRRLVVRSAIPQAEVKLGDSLALDGCCLTVVDVFDACLAFEAATETLARTTMGAVRPGARINMERALRFGDRLGGHLVAGHVDGVGQVVRRQVEDSAVYVSIEAPAEVARLTAPRGSITVAGVSLTVTDVQAQQFTVALIPHTLAHTTFDALAVGQAVNLEADLVARYIERLLADRVNPGERA